MKQVLTIDIGGSNVKLLASGQDARRRMPSGATLTPRAMVEGVRAAAGLAATSRPLSASRSS